MQMIFRRLAAWLPCLMCTPLLAAPLAYEPVGLGWSASEVERIAALETRSLTERAAKVGELGCRSQCDRLSRVFARLVPEARQQNARGAALPWRLIVVRLDDIDAEVISGGNVVVSEPFAARRLPSEEALAFVVAHEMAHDILEHERQSLSYARQLLPRQPERTVSDMYVEMDFNMSLRRAMAPVVKQGEFEADELGFMMASSAGYAPERQLAFLTQECRSGGGKDAIVETHPAPCDRLRALQALLPLARRQARVALPGTGDLVARQPGSSAPADSGP